MYSLDAASAIILSDSVGMSILRHLSINSAIILTAEIVTEFPNGLYFCTFGMLSGKENQSILFSSTNA